jgi:predicted AAA+ superfamily ATPase
METARSLSTPVAADLGRKMVFIAGPRQVGKTTFARRLLADWPAGLYLSWDRSEDRRTIRAGNWPGGRALVVLDELHKMRGWKRWLKGEHDAHGERTRFLVTGSARMDVFRRGGDSLQGRYHHVRLHPFTVGEVLGRMPAPVPGTEIDVPAHAAPAAAEAFDAIERFSGFPEPFVAHSDRVHRRWQKERLERFFREDVRDLEPVRDFARIELLADLLIERVASPLSVNSLREDLETSHRALTEWLEVLDRLYHVFRVRPFAAPLARTLTKMPKVYPWDPSLVAEAGGRFESVVASHLLRLCHWLSDVEGHDVTLHYLRDRDGRETDFLVTWKRRPWFAVEAKLSERPADPSLVTWARRLRVPFAYQLHRTGTGDFMDAGVRVLPASRFFAALP